MRYPVVIHREQGTGYGVTVPDLPGVFTAGDTIDEALAAVQEAVEAAFDGEAGIPGPSSIQAHIDHPDYADGIWALADVDLSRIAGPAIRVNITLPQRDLDAIDRAAEELGENRSAFLRNAALARIGALEIREPRAGEDAKPRKRSTPHKRGSRARR